jgi:hypothetical protein
MYSCVLVDIVPVSSKEPVEVDQEQVFEKEEPQCLSKEGSDLSLLIRCAIDLMALFQKEQRGIRVAGV